MPDDRWPPWPMMTDIPKDIAEAAARFDDRYPLMPELEDRPYRLRFWGRDKDALRQRMIGAGIPVVAHGDSVFSGFFLTTEAREALVIAAGEVIAVDRIGLDDGIEPMDARLIAALVAEVLLPDGRHHLLAYDDLFRSFGNTEFCWHDGNWSCDCNRALDLHRDGVRDLGFPLDEDGEPDPACAETLRLGWLVLRHRHLVTGEVTFTVIDEGEAR